MVKDLILLTPPSMPIRVMILWNTFVEYLPAYLAHSHGTEVYCWFMPDAVTKAQAMGWDDQKNQPISPDGN